MPLWEGEGEREKGRKGEREKGRKGEREKGRKGEREKGRKGERVRGKKKEREKKKEEITEDPYKPSLVNYKKYDLHQKSPTKARSEGDNHNLLEKMRQLIG